MRYYPSEKKMFAVNNSKAGGREEFHRIVKERGGKVKVLDSYPTYDMASKMYQTYRHELRTTCKKDSGTILKLQSVRKISSNDNGVWDLEMHRTTKATKIKPYSKKYATKLKKLMH